MPDGDDNSDDSESRQRTRNTRPRRFSDILQGLAADDGRDRIAVSDILEAMGDRSFGALMLVFAIPNIIPTPPGTSAILGAPLVFLAAQLAFGKKPWLPRFIAERSVRRADFSAVVGRTAPWLAHAERLLRPRLSTLVRPPAEYAVGFLCLVLAVILFLPIPLGNILPALTICLFSFAILERDGLWALAGLAGFMLSVIVVAGVLVAIAMAVFLLLTNLFL